MPPKMLPSSVTDENRRLQKQIGCINGLFQLLHRRHFLANQSMSSHHLLPGPQQQPEPHNARSVIIEKDLEGQKLKPHVSSESSQASTSSSYSSSTLSSLDFNKRINTPNSSFQITALKEREYSSIKGQKSPDIQDEVKDSMYREARCVRIKTFANDDRKVKHTDSPRPLQQTKYRKTKELVYECTKDSQDERLVFPHFSYDGRESRDMVKTNMKLKELPRFSLDSKPSSIKGSTLESRLKFLGRDETENSHRDTPVNQESGSHSRSNSIVAKLMGLDTFPDSITADESLITKTRSSPSPSPRPSPSPSPARVAFFPESSRTAEGRKQKQDSSSSPVSQKNPASPSSRLHNGNSLRKQTCLRVPNEPAPWKQQDYNQGSPKMTTPSAKAPTNCPRPSSSVYGEIEKRITELEFKRSGKDLRALKQILEAMQKTRERLETHGGDSTEPKKQERISLRKEIPHLQKDQTEDPEYHRENSAQKEKARCRVPKDNNKKEANQRIPFIEKKITCRYLEGGRTLKAPQCVQVENSTIPTRGFGMVDPRMRYTVVKTERESLPNRSTSGSSAATKQTSKKVREKCPQNKKHRVKSTDSQLSDDQLSSLSSETRYSSYHGDTASTKSESNNSITSHVETEVVSFTNSISTNLREQQDFVTTLKENMPTVKLAVAMMEQPSPVSVLDTPFYGEGSPSPVKKISTAFQEDESPSPDEAEWHLENLKPLTDSTKCDSGYKYNQRPENQLRLIHEPRFLKTEANETAMDNGKSAYQSINPGQKYLAKISGLLKDARFIQTANQLFSSCHPISSDMFHALEAKEELMEEAIGALIEKNDQMKLHHKIHGKIVSDMISEIMARKMTSDRLLYQGKKRTSLQGIVKEVYLEMDHLCRLPYCNLDDEDDDGWIGLLTADMKYQSDDWTDYRGEVPALVLDIERLIFKDLINEIITSEVVGLHGRPKKHCRQLFVT